MKDERKVELFESFLNYIERSIPEEHEQVRILLEIGLTMEEINLEGFYDN